MSRHRPLLAGLLVAGALIVAQRAVLGEENLVQNPDFAAAGEQGLPAHWWAWTGLVEAAQCNIHCGPDAVAG